MKKTSSITENTRILQSFLLRLSDTLRPLENANEIQEAAMKLLSEELAVMRATDIETDAGRKTIEQTARYEKNTPPFPDALRESQKRFESIANLIPDLLWDSEPDGLTNWYNQQWLEYTGQRFEQAIGWGWVDAIHPDDREGSAKRYHEAVETGRPLQQEHRIRRHDGAYRWFVVNALPFKNEKGQVVKMYGSATDIDDRKQAEEALRESEEHNRAMVGQTSVGIFRTDLTGAITFMNEKAAELFGFEHGEGIGTNVLDITVAEFRENTLEKFKNAVEHGKSFESEKRMIRKDGSEFWANVSVAAIKNGDHKTKSIVAVLIDITNRKTTEETLRKSEQQLRELLTQRDEFISVASHELKTPVTSIKAYAEIVQERLEEIGNTADTNILAKLNTQIDRLSVLINTLLDISQMSESKLQLHFSQFDINEIIADTIQEFKRTSKHQFEYIPQQLPDIYADRERIGQVITNLFSNAIKYSAERTLITIKVHLNQDAITVSVRDQGFGIPKADLDKVFDKFFRVTTGNRDTFPGLGLGLYVTMQIITEHGGSITVESVEKKGSVFTFSLPYHNPGSQAIIQHILI